MLIRVNPDLLFNRYNDFADAERMRRVTEILRQLIMHSGGLSVFAANMSKIKKNLIFFYKMC